MKRNCTVRIRPFQEGMDASISAKWDVVTMQNLSESGILFTSTEKLPLGAMFEFNISSPFNPDPVHCIGQVVRVEEKQSSKISVAQISVYSIAVLFKNIDADKQEAIKKICGGN